MGNTSGRALRAVLFDLHDTLVRVREDNLRERRLAAYRVLQAQPGAPTYEAFEARDDEVRESLRLAGAAELRDYGVAHRFRLVVEGLLRQGPPDGLVARMVDAYVDAWIGTLAPMPGAVEALEALRPRYRMALVTDFGDAPGIGKILARFGLEGYFRPVVISAEVGHTKPHPAMFTAALEGLGVSPAECVFVGDNPARDVEGARQAGIRPVLVDVAGQHPEHDGKRIADLRELPPLLEKRDLEV